MSNVGLVHEGNEIPLYDFKGFSLLLFFTFVLFCLQFIYVYIYIYNQKRRNAMFFKLQNSAGAILAM